MFIAYLAVVATAITPSVYAHFNFVRISHNGEWHTPTRYIRNLTAPYEEDWTPNQNWNTRNYIDPTYATDRPNSVRCGRDNMAHGPETETLTVQAGDTIEFAHSRWEPWNWKDAMFYNCSNGRGSCEPQASDGTMDFNHPGPVIAHLSKVPEGQDVTTYDGSGEWVKIYTLGLDIIPTNNNPVHWLAYNYQKLTGRVVFNIPAQTPAGQYLLRVDLVNTGLKYDNSDSQVPAQLYPGCAQILVESKFGGELPAGIKIPEDFSHASPGMATGLDMNRQLSVEPQYVYPGGPLWNGETLVQDKPPLN